VREFEQAEMEFFIHPDEREKWFAYWREERMRFHVDLGLAADSLRNRAHESDELAHYANVAEDVEFLFPFDWQEIEGVHDRGDWDLSRHTEYSGKELSFTDPETKESFTPMVIETAMGVDRTCLALLTNAYDEEDLGDGDTRTVMHFAPAVAPIKVAVLPLSKKLAEPAREIERSLRRNWNCAYDESGNIGRRYRRQDEVGTPFCVTFDFDSLDDGKVTVRERDSMDQERVAADDLVEVLRPRLQGPA
jgi:glycyl-tRNA synthetase